MRVKQVDSFTSSPFAGNPAAVVLDADELNKNQMQIIAREMNLSETCFVSAPAGDEADFRFRWFTPSTEVDACGHATLAGLHTLVEEGHVPLSEEPTLLRLETKSGIWQARIWLADKRPMIMFSMLNGPIALEPYPNSLSELAQALGTDVRHLTIGGSEPEIVVANYPQLVVPISSMEVLRELKPDHGRLAGMLGRLNTSMHIFTLETVDEASDAHSRHFAPNFGVDEDPVTGAGNAALFAYMVARDLVPVEEPVTYLMGEQGHIIGYPGYVSGAVHVMNGQINSVEIGGSAATVMNADIQVPP
jgi:trans-2,3-dihydro-3-hydroxyanthranilate isomerase